MIHSFSDFLGLSVTAVWAYPFVKSYTDRNFYTALIPFAAWIVTLATSIIKKGTERWLPNIRMFHRPEGASNCDLWNRGGDVGGAPGFPSGHTATAAFLATVLSYDSSLTVKLFAGTWVFAVAMSRILKRCHTELQVGAGGIFGCAVGLLYKYFL